MTIAGKLSDDLAIGTANSILKQAQLKITKIAAPDDLEPDETERDDSEELN